ncbi:MAG TPA: acyl-CoA dehydrogenase family protein [Candidatus Dormibacteraeota bacterium]
MDFALGTELARYQERVRGAVAEIVAPDARESDEKGQFRRDVIDRLVATGTPAWGVEHGSMALSLFYEELGRADSSVRGFFTVQLGLVLTSVMVSGSAEQRRRWAGPLAQVKEIGCYALTEPEAGSDARSLSTHADRDQAGWVINGEKHWITNGGAADVAVLFAGSERGMTAFLVPTDTPGFEREPMPGRELGHRASGHVRMRFRGLRVPHEAVLGEVGQGYQVAMGALRHGRLGVASGAVGIHQACLDACVDFGRRRRQFGQRIGDFEMIQAALADMKAELDASRLLARRAAWLLAAGSEEAAQALAVAKLYCCDAALRAADQAILIHGARGYSSEFPVERYWRDAKGMQIYEGTSHIQRVIVARSLLGKEER